MQAIAGIFASRDEAQRAVDELRVNGFPEDRVTMLSPDTPPRELQAVPTTEGEQPGVGTAIGGVVGLATGGQIGLALGGLFVPGVGPVIASGLLGAALLGVTGAAVGAAVENALTEGLPKDELFLYEEALRDGRSVVVALAEDARQLDSGRDVVARAGAETVDAARERWWIATRDAERKDYAVEGADFDRDEAAFRRGFEVALTARVRGSTYEESLAHLQEIYPSVYADPGFRLGFTRGQAHYQHLRGRPAPPSLRKTA